MHLTPSSDSPDIILEPLDLVTSLSAPSRNSNSSSPSKAHANCEQLTIQSPQSEGAAGSCRNRLTGHPAPPAAPWISPEPLSHCVFGEPLASELAVLFQPQTPEHAGEGRLPAAVPGVSSHGSAALLPDTTPSRRWGHIPLGPTSPRARSPQDLLPQRALPSSHLTHSPAAAVPATSSQRHSQAAGFFGRAASTASGCAGSGRHEAAILPQTSGSLARPGVFSSPSAGSQEKGWVVRWGAPA